MTKTPDRVLVVDDESAIRRALRTTLTSMGFTVGDEPTGERAIEVLRSEAFDAVLLDINMPGMGGIAACRLLRREHPQVGILMLTVREGQDDKVSALNAGADDYVIKPFELRELVARLKAILRRVHPEPALKPVSIRIGELELNDAYHLLTKAGEPIHLTPKEFDMLRYMMVHAGELVPHARLLRAIWGPEYGGELEYLRTFMRQLRKKIEDDPAQPTYLLTEPYAGYRFRPPDE